MRGMAHLGPESPQKIELGHQCPFGHARYRNAGTVVFADPLDRGLDSFAGGGHLEGSVDLRGSSRAWHSSRPRTVHLFLPRLLPIELQDIAPILRPCFERRP